MLTSQCGMCDTHMAVFFTAMMWDWSSGKNKCALRSLIKTHTVSNIALKAPLNILRMPESALAMFGVTHFGSAGDN